MSTLSLEEVRRRLEEIPAQEFRDTSQTWAIGQIYRITSNDLSFVPYWESYPSDVMKVVSRWNDSMSPEERKALAMMLPLPESFPDMTINRARKLIAWSIKRVLNGYEGPGKEVLESAVALAQRAIAGHHCTEEEAKVIIESSNVIRTDETVSLKMSHAIHCMVYVLVTATLGQFMSDAVGTIVSAAMCFRDSGADWRQWMEEYLRFRCQQ